jgi:hypothetical protein
MCLEVGVTTADTAVDADCAGVGGEGFVGGPEGGATVAEKEV